MRIYFIMFGSRRYTCDIDINEYLKSALSDTVIMNKLKRLFRYNSIVQYPEFVVTIQLSC